MPPRKRTTLRRKHGSSQGPAPTTPDIAFLGLCDRARGLVNHQGLVVSHNVLGLSSIIAAPVYPFPLKTHRLALAIYNADKFKPGQLVIRSSDGKKITAITLGITLGSTAKLKRPRLGTRKGQALTSGTSIEPDGMHTAAAGEPEWFFLTTPIPPEGTPVAYSPDRYSVHFERGRHSTRLGSILFVHAPVEPFSEEHRLALRSDPKASKQVTFVVGCKTCGGTFKAYFGLQTSDKREAEGYLWAPSLGEHWNCPCGLQSFGLSYIRDNLHWFLLRPNNAESTAGAVRLYEQDAVADTCRGLLRSLAKHFNAEEPIHQYIKTNPLLLCPFAAQKIWSKQNIFDKHTDFAVYDRTGGLTLIEIERPSHRLLTKTGDPTAPLTHAIGQCQEWIHLLQENRDGALRAFDLAPQKVNRLRAIVIIGRDAGHDPEHLRRLKWADRGPVEVWTYDDMVHRVLAMGDALKGA